MFAHTLAAEYMFMSLIITLPVPPPSCREHEIVEISFISETMAWPLEKDATALP
jgi:hypothetical protein